MQSVPLAPTLHLCSERSLGPGSPGHIKKAPPRKDRFDVNGAITEVIALARSEVAKHGALVETRLAEGLFPIRGDRVQLQQVVLNLILNAVEAMDLVGDKPRRLLISTKQSQAKEVLVAVQDFRAGNCSRKISRMCLAVPRLSSPCLPTPTSPRDWIVLARTQLGFGESASTVLSLCKRFSIRRPASKRPSSFSHSRTKFASFYRIQHGKPWPLGMVAACNRMALSGAETMRACLICCSWPSIPRLRAI